MFSIQTNVNSLIAQENLRVNSNFQSQTIQRLTSGYRINQSGDDAAGLAVANKFRSDVSELTQGVHNANDGISTLQIIDGGMNNISHMLDRLKTLASQSASQTFTGDRGVVNSEFQSLLTEINRQSQAIGLDQGGLNAKTLSVYVGGGRTAGTGTVSTDNGTVNLDLSASTVDAQSLGLKGMQAVAGTQDLTNAVQGIVQNNANTTATTGSTAFYISGPGFSDGGKIKVSVNLSGVGDMNSLVAAINTGIQNAANDNTQAAAAFKLAGITASVHTGTGAVGDTAANTEQLAFTSASSAFQVEAGDVMANALMGNRTGTAGTALQTTVSGATTAASTDGFSNIGKTVRIQGAGLAAPVDLTFSSQDSTVGGAITDLVNQVSQNSTLKAAGISVTTVPSGSGTALQFSNARGESFNVMATGDTLNQLGLGSFVTNTNGAADQQVDYNSITGTSYNFGTSANDTASLQLSLNGSAAVSVPTIDLTGGDAVASAISTSTINNPNVIVSQSVATGTAAITNTNWNTGNSSFTVAVSGVNGGAAQTINLTTNYTGTAGTKAALVSEINGQLQGATASISNTGALVLTANATAATTIAVAGAAAVALAGGGTFGTVLGSASGNDLLSLSVDGISVSAKLSATTAASTTGTGNLFANGGTVQLTAASSAISGNGADINVVAHDFSTAKNATESFTVSVDSGPAQTVTLSTNMTNIGDYITAIGGQLQGATVQAVPGNANKIQIISNSTGTASHITLANGTSHGTSLVSGTVSAHNFSTAGAAENFKVSVDGQTAQTITLNTDITNAQGYVDAINGQLTGAKAIKGAGETFSIVSNSTGANSSISLTEGSKLTSGFSATSGTINAHDFRTTNENFQVQVDGSGTWQTITLSGNMTTAQNYVDAINGQLVGARAVKGAGETFFITSNATGNSSAIALREGSSATSGIKTATGAVSASTYSSANASFTVSVNGGAAQTINLTTDLTDAASYVAAINPQLQGAHVVQNGETLSIVSNTTGTGSTISVTDGTNTPLASHIHFTNGLGTAGAAGTAFTTLANDMNLSTGGATAGGTQNFTTLASDMNLSTNAGSTGATDTTLATYLGLSTGTVNGGTGNNQLLISSDVTGLQAPAVVTIAAGTYTGAQMVNQVNIALKAAAVGASYLLDAGGTSGVIASLDSTGRNLVLSSTTMGTASKLSIAAPPAVNGTVSSALTQLGLGTGGTTSGGAATAGSIATTIQNAIDAATGAAAGDAHATVVVNGDNSLTITNDTKGAAHSISALSGDATGLLGTGTNAVAGKNLSGTAMQNSLNQFFSSAASGALQGAQLQATWSSTGATTGTLRISSANNTNFRINSGTTGSGVATGSVDLNAANGHDWSTGAESFRLKIDGNLSANITLNTHTTDAATTLTAVRNALTAANVTGVTASLDNGHHLVFTSNSTGASSSVQVENPSSGNSALGTLGLTTKAKIADANLGFGVSGSSFTSNLAVSTVKNAAVDAGGASSAIDLSGNALSFSALKYGNDAQAITISANGPDGTQQSTTVTLKNIATEATTDNRAGVSIDAAIAYINSQLQQSNNPTLKQIVAVKENKSGADQINFVSGLPGFKVSVASSANADGVNNGTSTPVTSRTVGNGSSISVDSMQNALVAVTAISTAVGKLGSAQAAVGKGQNQLNYALNLAQSQISNFSAAESRIRDADVASEAANLTKAQVLQQASIAAMAQANSAPQAVLALLRG